MKEMSYKFNEIPESVWVEVESNGYNRDAIMSAFDKYDRNLGGQVFDQNLIERSLWKKGICSSASENDFLVLTISMNGEINFKRNCLHNCFSYDPKKPDEFTVCFDNSKCLDEEKDENEAEDWFEDEDLEYIEDDYDDYDDYDDEDLEYIEDDSDDIETDCDFDLIEDEIENDEDMFEIDDKSISTSDELSRDEFESLLAFGISVLAVTLEEFFDESGLYGSRKCLERAKSLAVEGKTLGKIVSELRYSGFCENDIFATVIAVMGNCYLK